ncbi:MAG: phage integrase N-terminal SAM-like domain-containing protein [Bacteroidota bacterium]|nr:phage integrase N-terminal SAM-like domain-containing protein [Bacteroidota bacterium]
MKVKQLKKVELASLNIPGFSLVLADVYKSMLINGLSKNTFDNYCRKLADICLRFNKLPVSISEDEMKDYLKEMIQGARDVSRSEFKHTIYSLRYYLKMIGEDINIKLPQIKNEKRLPVVLSKDECRSLFELTKNIKHRAILMFI